MTYTLIVAIMVMNLVIAVILESYEDTGSGFAAFSGRVIGGVSEALVVLKASFDCHSRRAKERKTQKLWSTV